MHGNMNVKLVAGDVSAIWPTAYAVCLTPPFTDGVPSSSVQWNLLHELIQLRTRYENIPTSTSHLPFCSNGYAQCQVSARRSLI